jgi:hypothetical protein
MGLKKVVFLAVAALAIALAVNAPSQADGRGFGDGHPGGFGVHHGFDGHRDFDRGVHGRFLFGFGVPVYPYYGYYPPAYGYQAPTYWYYCRSYGAYYPSVTSCPEAWVPVPAS